MHLLRRPVRIAGIAWALPLAVALATAGCKNTSSDISDIDLRGNRGLAGSEDHLGRAIATLERLDQYDQQQARSKVISQLSQWIESQPPVDAWAIDPLVATLPARYNVLFQYAPLERMEFIGTDFNFLSETVWLRQIADWQMDVLRARHPEPFRRLEDLATQVRKLEDQREDIAVELDRARNRNEASDVTTAERIDKLETRLASINNELPSRKTALATAEEDAQLLRAKWFFDWTVRNIQLDKTHWNARFPTPEQLSREEALTPPPGAALHVWQALLLGHGDAATRARAFLLLCRQQGIDVVMLGLQSPETGRPPREWAAAAVIGEDLWLFEPELGMPIPGPENVSGEPANLSQSICTLAQLREQPELLRRLDTKETAYHVRGEDLERVVPLIDAGLESLSQRMMLIEQSLTEDQQLAITSAPSQMAKRLRKLKLPSAQIWAVPYRVYVYEALRQDSPATARKFHQQMAVFVPPIELWKARLHHFRGQMDQPDAAADGTSASPMGEGDPSTAVAYKHGARHYYLACRNPEGEIESIQNELEAWFAQDATKSRNELLAQLRFDIYRLNEYRRRRSELKAGDIDPAEQFYRQQLEAEAAERDPEAIDESRSNRRELTPEEVEQVREIEQRLEVLSPATREWIQRLPPDLLAMGAKTRGDFLQHFKQVATRAKQHATWWLGIAAMEAQQPGVAASFFRERILQADSESPWTEYAHQQLGRVYESAGQYDQAVEHYQDDRSPQRLGSLVRAKLLTQQSSAPDGESDDGESDDRESDAAESDDGESDDAGGSEG